MIAPTAIITSLTTNAELSLWNMLLKGGWLMLPIFILSLIAVYIFCERYLSLRKYNRMNDSSMSQIQDGLFANNARGAIQICKISDTPISRILIKGILHRDLPASELRAIIEGCANLEVDEMEKGLATLATCAGMAPMIGFLGTVVGMIQAFYDMAAAGSNVNITLLSSGIYTAMITTMAGLVVGIIAHFAYNILTARINRVVSQMEAACADFMEIIYEIQSNKQNQ